MTKRGKIGKVRLFRVDLVSRFGVMLQENNGKVGLKIHKPIVFYIRHLHWWAWSK
jgi:hypothetical protein